MFAGKPKAKILRRLCGLDKHRIWLWKTTAIDHKAEDVQHVLTTTFSKCSRPDAPYPSVGKSHLRTLNGRGFRVSKDSGQVLFSCVKPTKRLHVRNERDSD